MFRIIVNRRNKISGKPKDCVKAKGDGADLIDASAEKKFSDQPPTSVVRSLEKKVAVETQLTKGAAGLKQVDGQRALALNSVRWEVRQSGYGSYYGHMLHSELGINWLSGGAGIELTSSICKDFEEIYSFVL